MNARLFVLVLVDSHVITFQAPTHTVCYLQLTTAGSRFLRLPTVNKSLIMPYNWTRRMPASSTTSDDRSPCVPTPPTPTHVESAGGSRNPTHPSTWIPLPSPTASAPSAPVSPAVSVAVECSDGYRTPQSWTCQPVMPAGHIDINISPPSSPRFSRTLWRQSRCELQLYCSMMNPAPATERWRDPGHCFPPRRVGPARAHAERRLPVVL